MTKLNAEQRARAAKLLAEVLETGTVEELVYELIDLRDKWAETQHDDHIIDERDKAEAQALARDTTEWLRFILGPHNFNFLWGPELEAFGRAVDEMKSRAARAERSEAQMRAAVWTLVLQRWGKAILDYPLDMITETSVIGPLEISVSNGKTTICARELDRKKT